MARAHIKQIARSGSIYLLPVVVTRSLGFLLLPVYTTYLTRSDYGLITTAAAGSSLVATAASLGMIDASSRLYFKYDADPAALGALLTTTLTFIVASCLIVIGLAALRLHWVAQLMFGTASLNGVGLGQYALVALCAVPFTQAFEHMLTVLQNNRQPGRYAVLRGINILTTIVLIVVLVVLFRKGAFGSIVANLVASIAASIAAFMVVRPYFRLRIDVAMLRQALIFGLPLAPYALSGWVVAWIDRIFLVHYYSLSVTGVYALAATLSTILQFVITAVMQAWTPIYYQTLERNGRAGQAEVVRTITFLIVVFSFAALGLALFAREVLAVMTRPRFHDAYHIVPYLVLYFLIGGINALLINNIYFSGMTKWLSPVTFISVLVIVPANILLVPRFGGIGAAAAAVVAALIYTTLDFVIAQRVYPMRFEYRAIAATVGLAVILFAASLASDGMPLALRLLLKALLLGAFPIGLLTLGVVKPADVARVIAVARRRIRRTGDRRPS